MKFVLNEQEIQEICFQHIVNTYGEPYKTYSGKTEITFQSEDPNLDIQLEIEITNVT